MRAQLIGPALIVILVPAALLAFYVYNLRLDLAASDRVIALERAAGDDWRHKFEDLQKSCVAAPDVK